MPTVRQQLALRERLQAVEDNLLAAGKRRVTIQGVAGVFQWGLPGAFADPAEDVFSDDIQEIEDMILAQEWNDIILATERGTFVWGPKSS